MTRTNWGNILKNLNKKYWNVLLQSKNESWLVTINPFQRTKKTCNCSSVAPNPDIGYKTLPLLGTDLQRTQDNEIWTQQTQFRKISVLKQNHKSKYERPLAVVERSEHAWGKVSSARASIKEDVVQGKTRIDGSVEWWLLGCNAVLCGEWVVEAR